MYTIDKVYRSCIYFISQLVPSGVVVVEGESYGVRTDDPTGKQPSIAVQLDDISDSDIELGSFGTRYPLILTIAAKSRLQRDALKSIVYSGLMLQPFAIYSDVTLQNTPASGSVVETYAEIASRIRIRDMPNFDDDREKFFWTSVVFTSLNILIV